HFTDRAVLDVLGEDRTTLLWQPDDVPAFHPNGMVFTALDEAGNTLGRWQVFSVGDGALREEGAEPVLEVYPLKDFAEAMNWADREGRPLWHLASEFDAPDIHLYLQNVWSQMQKTIAAGLEKDEVLPGALHLARKAYLVYGKARLQKDGLRRTGLLAAYALACGEENASCGAVVTAPTCGACGVLPAVLRYLQEETGCSDARIVSALAAAGIIGNTAKQNASISGAEVGCQGEIGVACAMAAGAAACLMGGTTAQIEYAAEIGLEHFLGLTCDPVLGLVQIPCIERNALAANRAVIAAEYALLSDGKHRVSFAIVVAAMKSTGHDLPALYRETSAGGLATIVR
ncbi:MAG: L-serine ammonia-lyase, iron-sulfur-dependent, subunit alpha, partial [Lentisphaeria bacterium]|nr:L-serine ammonia-lyase, iron-sulfur-dependent, subunit alpha [Lentisphaeria bacterium]